MTWALLLATMASAGPALPATWDFQADTVGEPPQGFYFQVTGNKAPPGKWRVLEDAGGRVLAQLDRTRSDRRSALAVVDNLALKDVRLTSRIKVVVGDEDRAGGVVWRYQDSENHLLARLSVREGNVRLYRVVDGNRVKFGGEDGLKLAPNRWYTLRVEHRGRRIKIYLDDEMLFDEDDRHFTKAGKVGLWTRADSVTYFDDVRAVDLDAKDDD